MKAACGNEGSGGDIVCDNVGHSLQVKVWTARRVLRYKAHTLLRLPNPPKADKVLLLSEGTMPQWSFEARLAMPVIVGLFGGPFYFYTLAVAMDLTNSWFKGEASLKEIRQALILGAIPRAVSVVFFLLLALVFGEAFFDDPDLPDGRPASDVFFYSCGILVIAALTVWRIVVTSQALAEVQGFQSAWKAWLHWAVAMLSMILALAIPVVLFIFLLRAA